jgi:hypothetical protein
VSLIKIGRGQVSGKEVEYNKNIESVDNGTQRPRFGHISDSVPIYKPVHRRGAVAVTSPMAFIANYARKDTIQY